MKPCSCELCDNLFDSDYDEIKEIELKTININICNKCYTDNNSDNKELIKKFVDKKTRLNLELKFIKNSTEFRHQQLDLYMMNFNRKFKDFNVQSCSN
jgi:ribosome-binding protein aMBF1 (putative translation factor)